MGLCNGPKIPATLLAPAWTVVQTGRKNLWNLLPLLSVCLSKSQEEIMRTLFLSLVAAAGVALATPALAQGVYFGGPGVSVGVGHGGPHGYRHRWRDDDRRWSRWHGGYRAYAYGGGCRDITVRRQRWDGTMVVKHIRRCD
jgi:hypothetical protein